MFFVFDNSDNIRKRANGNRSDFWDECGSWVKGATPCSTFIEQSGKLTTVYRHKGQYCFVKFIDKKKEYVPFDPQPAETEIISIHRCYLQLKASNSDTSKFKKMVTWVEKTENIMPEIANNIAIVEYIGSFPERQCHGSVKDIDKNVKYIGQNHEF